MRAALAGAGMVMTCLSSALAAPQTGSWTIGPIGGANTQHCSMKNAYANGHALVFARDISGSGSIAVDMGTGVLKAGQKYPVEIDIPPLARKMTAVAASPRVLLLATGYDAAFYDALASGHEMFLSALNARYSYSLEGTRDALQALDDCAGFLGVENMPAVAVVPVQRFEPVIKVHRGNDILPPAFQDSRVDDEAERLRADNAALQQQLTAAKEAQEKAIVDEARRSAEAAARAAAQQEKDKLERLVQENVVLRKSLTDVQARVDALSRAVAAPPVAPVPAAVVPAVVAAAPSPVAPPAPPKAEIVIKKSTPDVNDLGNILARSRIVPRDALTPSVDGGAWVYRWQAGAVSGLAQERTRRGMTGAGTFDTAIKDYLAEKTGQCAGDFAHVAGVREIRNGVTLQKAETACIGDTRQTAAAVLFLEGAAGFAVISHEGATDNVHDAIAKRDAMAAAVVGK